MTSQRSFKKRGRSAARSITLIIARHAESGMNDQNRIQGHQDSKLTAQGNRQAALLAKRLGGMKITKIYSSDLGRAMATSRAVAAKLRLPILEEPRLREINLGRWEGLTPEEVNAQFQNGYNLWRKSPSSVVIPDAETVRSFHVRIRKIFEEIGRTEKKGPVFVMTHGGVIASLLTHWLEADFDRVLLNVKIDNTSLTFAEFKKNRVVLHAINDIAHLSKEKPNDFTVFTESD